MPVQPVSTFSRHPAVCRSERKILKSSSSTLIFFSRSFLTSFAASRNAPTAYLQPVATPRRYLVPLEPSSTVFALPIGISPCCFDRTHRAKGAKTNSNESMSKSSFISKQNYSRSLITTPRHAIRRINSRIE